MGSEAHCLVPSLGGHIEGHPRLQVGTLPSDIRTQSVVGGVMQWAWHRHLIVPLFPRAWLTVIDSLIHTDRSEFAAVPFLQPLSVSPCSPLCAAWCTLASSGGEDHRACLGHFGISSSCSQAQEGRMMSVTPGYIVFGS